VEDLVHIAQTGGALVHKTVRAVPAALDSGTKNHTAAAGRRAECKAAAEFLHIVEPGCGLNHHDVDRRKEGWRSRELRRGFRLSSGRIGN